VFVVFEGIDGSGKTTLSNAVVRALRESGRTVKHLRAEGKFASSVTEAIRALGRDSRNLDMVPRAEFLLYVAREVQLMEEALAPALRTHDVVIADRFLYTAEVLGRSGRGLPPAFTAPVLDAALQGFQPDLVLLVDVDPSLARARRRASKLLESEKKPPSRKGLTGVGLQHRLRTGYLELARSAPERWLVVNNDRPLAETSARVTALIDGAVASGAKAASAAFRATTSGTPTPAVQRLLTVSDALSAFLAWVTPRVVSEPSVAAYFLTGLSGDSIHALRRELARVVPEAVLAGLRGLEDDASWELRHALCSAQPAFVAKSLGNLPAATSRAASLRAELFDAAPREVVASLGAESSAEAWALREKLNARDPDALVAHLGTMNDDRAWEIRDAFAARHGKKIVTEYELATMAAKSVSGLSGERAARYRAQAQTAAPIAALRSLAGLVDEETWAIRERYLTRAPKAVMSTLSRVRDDRAWQMRRAVAAECKEALDGVSGMPDAPAWSLRDDFADVWPSTVVKSLGPLADEPRGEALLRRQLGSHPTNLSLLKHAAAIALGCHRFSLEDDD
jgi:dTMP kinase